MDDLAQAIMASSQRLGVSPVDLGTVISYETGGTFDPWKAGPTTKYGQHRGLIQWGEPQRQQYGVRQGMPNAQQMMAVEKYLTKAGVKPGMGLLDIYSAVNAGRVGRYNASDAAAGGAPGTVADKVNNQMGGHQQKAMALLGGQMATPVANVAPIQQSGAPVQIAAAPMAPTGFDPMQRVSGLPPQIDAMRAEAAGMAGGGVSSLGDMFAQGVQDYASAEQQRAEAQEARRQRLLAMIG